jgi:organic hydroperoxide reductase OsmC/OhrA
MLWYLHLCAVNDVVVTSYEDNASGTMIETEDGGGRFENVVLRPSVGISAQSDTGKAVALHAEAHRLCFIANSVNFAVTHEPSVVRATA